ncbi:MAG TPA: S41 family peptidase [Candidatus Eisenbacteria bacterium]|jgi:carboxyl-terminal processing protease|nr:S41 family peptidase [Candidatus Eisenbacteria bacterium]
MKRRTKFVLFLLLPAAFALWAAAAFSHEVPGTMQERLRLEEDLNLLVDVLAIIKTEYVDDVPLKKLMGGAMSGMLKALDPYSQFLDEDAYRDLKVDTEGRFGGLGLEVSVKNGHLHVIAPLDDTPAARAGIVAGDTILKLNGESTRDLSLSEAVKRMRGAPGSKLALTVMREGQPKLIEFEIARDTIQVKSVKEARLVDGKTGYIRLSSFQEKSPADFTQAVDGLLAQGMTGLILDVRNNAGGLLSAAVAITERFVPEGEVIVTTRGRNPSKSSKFVSHNKKPYSIRPLIVLVNKGSASGSEIFAGAVQDYRLGTVVGQKTFGKASVQTLIPLPDGSAIRLTTSKYYTPNGRLLHEAGVVPDVAVESDESKPPGGADPVLERAIALAGMPAS